MRQTRTQEKREEAEARRCGLLGKGMKRIRVEREYWASTGLVVLGQKSYRVVPTHYVPEFRPTHDTRAVSGRHDTMPTMLGHVPFIFLVSCPMRPIRNGSFGHL